MNEEKCPFCPNHCAKDNLGCGRGKDFFDNQGNSSEPKSIQQQVIVDLRKCGHLLHHNRKLNTDQLLSVFSVDELGELHSLLSKIVNNS